MFQQCTNSPNLHQHHLEQGGCFHWRSMAMTDRWQLWKQAPNVPRITEGLRQTGPGNWCGGVGVVGWSSFDIASTERFTLLSFLKRDTGTGRWKRMCGQVTQGAKMSFLFMKGNHRGRQVCSRIVNYEFRNWNTETCPTNCSPAGGWRTGSHNNILISA